MTLMTLETFEHFSILKVTIISIESRNFLTNYLLFPENSPCSTQMNQRELSEFGKIETKWNVC